MNKKVKICRRGVDELYRLYLLRHANGQIHVYFIASSIKIITKHNVPCTNSSQPKLFHIKTDMHDLGLWFANTAAAKIIINHILWG